MDPSVRYVHSADGTVIAYWAMGEGRPLVQMPMVPFSHIEAEWRHPEMRHWYQRLARGATLVRYDARDTGLSQRATGDHSLDAQVADLAAVVDALGPDPVDLIGVFHSGPVAIAFAARNPQRVRRLVLWCTYARGEDYWRATQAEGLRGLRQTDYSLFLRTAAHELVGWQEDEAAAGFADVMRRAVEPEAADALIAATRDFDVTDRLGAVGCPTLVVHRRDLHWLEITLSRDLASRIEGATLTVIDGASPLPGAGDVEVAAAPIEGFLDIASAPMAATTESVRVVLFTDLVNHTETMARLGDERGRELLRGHEALVRGRLGTHGGTEVKTLGDGFMASFAGVTGALRCAGAIQHAIVEWNTSDDARRLAPLAVRIGINAGEPISEEDDLFGATVIIASRVAAVADGGQVLVANTVRELGMGKGFRFTDRGEFTPKGFEQTIRLWELDWSD